MFELVIWLQEVTLARWTQPSGPLCLWQCLFTITHLLLYHYSLYFCLSFVFYLFFYNFCLFFIYPLSFLLFVSLDISKLFFIVSLPTFHSLQNSTFQHLINRMSNFRYGQAWFCRIGIFIDGLYQILEIW